MRRGLKSEAWDFSERTLNSQKVGIEEGRYFKALTPPNSGPGHLMEPGMTEIKFRQ